LRNALKLQQVAHAVPADAGGAGAARFFQIAPGALMSWLIFFASTIAVSLLFERLGFALAISLYMLVTMRWVARQSWVSTVILAVTTPIVLFLIFVRVLRVPLPLAPPGF
jgi:hypothetical protein